VQRFRGGLVFKAHRLCVSLNSRLESNKEEEEVPGGERAQELQCHISAIEKSNRNPLLPIEIEIGVLKSIAAF